MKKKRLYNRVVGGVLAFLMIISLGLSPITSQVVWAESDNTISEEKDGDIGTTEIGETTDDVGSNVGQAKTDDDEKGSITDVELSNDESTVISEETTTPTEESTVNKARTTTTESGLEIVAEKDIDDLVYEEDEEYDIASYFNVHYNEKTPYAIWDDDNEAYVCWWEFSKLFKITYYRIVAGKEIELYSKPSRAGKYKADVEFSATTYWVYEESTSEGTMVNINGDEKVSVQFTIGEDENLKEFSDLQLVYGNKNLADEKAFVLLMFGDGFNKDEQEKFYVKAEETADYIMNTSPYDEFKDIIKIYAYGTVSNQSGARGENATSEAAANADEKDTYFQTSFWSWGMERLLSVGDYGMTRINEILDEEWCPSVDYSVIIVNSTKYGGSGGDVCVASLNTSSLEMMLHELGHTVAKLADEYWPSAGYEAELANMTSDPENVPWARFVGKNGIGVYKYDQNELETDWYKPSENCKMQYLGAQYPFCEVCKEELRKAICRGSDITKIFFQTYADEFYPSNDENEINDMKEYFIIRRGSEEITGDLVGNALTLTYKDAEGNTLESPPSKTGTYKITAKFNGYDIYEGCEEIEVEYTINLPDLITFDGVESKVYDGTPVEPKNIVVDYEEGDVDIDVHYEGTMLDSSHYDSDEHDGEAPYKPGSYTVTVTAKDKTTQEDISRKSKDYKITIKTNTIVNNNTSTYPGAQDNYNNKHIVIMGDGFTAEEQDTFEKLAEQYVEYILSIEPFKETKLYFNFTSANAISEKDDNYFKTRCNDNGDIILSAATPSLVGNIGYNLTGGYNRANIVIVNDKNVKNGTVDNDGSRAYIYGGTDEESMKFAARELLNFMTGQKEGYEATTKEQIAAQRDELLKYLNQSWYGEDYAVVVSQAYNKTFVENGSQIRLDDYFQTYVVYSIKDESTGEVTTGLKEVPREMLHYTLTYYDSDWKELEDAPSKAGTYYVRAELLPPDDGLYVSDYFGTVFWKVSADEVDEDGCVYDENGNEIGWTFNDLVTSVTVDGTEYRIPRVRGETSFTIQPASTSGGSGNTGDSGNTSDSGNTDNSGNTSDSGNANGASNATSDSESAAKTGDTAPWALYLILLAGAAVICGTVVVKRRRR